ncbi:ATP-grasp domain-containing protein [Streptomyces avidinii]|uniref:Biotin carboxylase n=1 Tax=Streptomyces avidinii TaxID=1895 RepID=A0ABS4KZ42_STRAV|nr:ATP-grasp domain-containing protein [Streptomyces avidinii]MBP2035273.1 biotin carboxylase [Streptomyces avidinii]GGZ03622.1 argininosuccinate lyase [Streptomyces avidinii]
MKNGAGPRGPGVLVIEPMGNAGRFLVEAADRLGVRLYAATRKDIHDDYPDRLRAALAGVCATDLTDTPRALEDMDAFCRQHAITAVAPCFELFTPLAALLAERIGLPGNDPGLARAARNKILMGEAFAVAGIPAPRWAVAHDAGEAHRVVQAHGLGWPLVVKPAEQGGSWGVSVVDGPDRLADAVGAAQQYTRAQPHGLELDTRALLQEYIPGAEYSCDTVVAGGVAYPLPVVAKDTTEGRYRIETGHTCPSGLPDPLVRKVQHTAARAALAVGVRNGIAHTEMKIPPGAETPYVIETGARLPGDNLCEIVEAATGVSEAVAQLQAVLGLVPDTVPSRTDAASIRFLLPEHGGVLREVVIPDLPGTHSEVHLRPGAVVPEPADSACRIGHVVARAETAEQARGLADRAAARSRAEVG